MPNYQYRCPTGHTIDRFYLFSEKKPKWFRCTCGKCMTRQVRFPQIYFRGPGFTQGGYDYMEEAATGRDFEAERKKKEYFETRDALDEHLDNSGLNIYEDKLEFTRTPIPNAV